MAEPRHDCPGGCGKSVPLHLLACTPCWYRLPNAERIAVSVAYGRRKFDPFAHVRAVNNATRWYRDNPAPVRVPAVDEDEPAGDVA